MIKCLFTNKSTRAGKNVSHSRRRTCRTFIPNMQQTNLSTINCPNTKIKISTAAMRTLHKMKLNNTPNKIKLNREVFLRLNKHKRALIKSFLVTNKLRSPNA